MPDRAAAPESQAQHFVVSNRPIHTITREMDFIAVQFLLRVASDGTLAKLTGGAAKILHALVSAIEDLAPWGNPYITMHPLDVKARAGVKRSWWAVQMRELIERGLVRRHDPRDPRQATVFEILAFPPPAGIFHPTAVPAGPRARARGGAAVAAGPRALADGCFIDDRAGAGARVRPAEEDSSAAAADPAAAAAAAVLRLLQKRGLPAKRVQELAELETTTAIVVEAAQLEAPTKEKTGLFIHLVKNPDEISAWALDRAAQRAAPPREHAQPASDDLRLQRDLEAQRRRRDEAIEALSADDVQELVREIEQQFPDDEVLLRNRREPLASGHYRNLIYAALLGRLVKEDK